MGITLEVKKRDGVLLQKFRLRPNCKYKVSGQIEALEMMVGRVENTMETDRAGRVAKIDGKDVTGMAEAFESRIECLKIVNVTNDESWELGNPVPVEL